MQHDWLQVCALSEVSESSPIEVEIAGVEILLVRIGDGVHAVPALCPHMDEPLIGGMCEGMTITCLKHLWQWDIRTGEPVSNAELSLKKFPVKVVEGTIYVDPQEGT